jgi:uncharacterized repeat protein (TIGR01451 family)
MMKRILFLLFVLALTVTATAAFQEQFTPIQNVISMDEDAKFNLTITNNQDTAQTYRLSLNVDQTTTWILRPNNVRVPADESRTVTVTLSPRAGTRSGSYFARIRLEGEGEQRVLSAPISFGQQGRRDFVPNVGMTVTNDENIDPREPFPLSFEFHNRNRRTLPNLTTRVNSELFQTSFPVSLDGLEREGQNVFFTLNDTTPPGEYNVDVNLFFKETDNPISSYSTTFNVVEYSDISIQQEQDQAWFKTSNQITLHNDGNIQRSYTYNVSAPWFERLFLSSPQDTSIGDSDDGAVKQWHVTIPPDESTTITYERNYRGLVAAIVLALLGVAAYFMFRSPVVVSKEGTVVKTPNGPDKLKIRLYLRNRGRSTAYNVSVTDTLPSILEYDDHDEVGYISPSRVRKKRKGETTVHWDIDELDALEERILVYEATPRLEVLGTVDLPSVRAQFEDEDGDVRVYETWSTSAGSQDSFLEK